MFNGDRAEGVSYAAITVSIPPDVVRKTGGSHRSIALQPLSVEGRVGVNLALGVAAMTQYAAP
jgi:esterase/lipase superfamily enzyme